MLINLHVKNLALIEEAEVDFQDGFNIMTGETGAGKSIIIGSVTIGLGGKVPKDIIRNGAEYGLIELVFDSKSAEVKEFFKEHDLCWEDGQVIITRKIMPGKNIIKVNGETISVSLLRELSPMLMNIHGQHDNEALLKTSKHLEMIDEFGGEQITNLKNEIKTVYQEYRKLREEWDDFSLDEETRRREFSLFEFEIHEIEQASLLKGEDEQLEEEYKLLSNGEKIAQRLGSAYDYLEGSSDSIREQLGRAVKEISELTGLDERLAQIYDTFLQLEDMSSGLSREVADFMEESTFSQERFSEVEKRLDEINRLKMKYGRTISDILNHKKKAEEKLDVYVHFEEKKKEIEKEIESLENKLDVLSGTLTKQRKKVADLLSRKLITALKDLNFLEVKFTAEFSNLNDYTASGKDSVEFFISTNPGETPKPLAKVASGGELSRIMLGFKTVMAGKDSMESLIFDEIDTGISGRTAQMVSEKLKAISKKHQIICITHLPQIAAMADTHYLIEKQVESGKTHTKINKLTEDAAVNELARLLSGAKITDTVLDSAKEMKRLAKEIN